jgi:PPM family protein phosphatase
MAILTSPEIATSALSDIGTMREENQDAFRLPEGFPILERGLLYAIADGMGGHSHGKLASTFALDKLFQVFYTERASPDKALRRAIEAANLGVYQTAQRIGAGCMGTTLTAVHLNGNRLHIAHVGDSRLYLIRDSHAECLTPDHSTAGELVRMNLISPDNVRTHDQRSYLTRAVGLELFIRPEITSIMVQDGDRLILCSDGVWSVIEDDEFATFSTAIGDADDLTRHLIATALERHTDDNASAVVIDLHQLVDSPAESEIERGWSLPQFLRSLTGAG